MRQLLMAALVLALAPSAARAQAERGASTDDTAPTLATAASTRIAAT